MYYNHFCCCLQCGWTIWNSILLQCTGLSWRLCLLAASCHLPQCMSHHCKLLSLWLAKLHHGFPVSTQAANFIVLFSCLLKKIICCSEDKYIQSEQFVHSIVKDVTEFNSMEDKDLYFFIGCKKIKGYHLGGYHKVKNMTGANLSW